MIYKLKFFSGDGLNPKLVTGLFLLKVAFGFLFFAVYFFYYGNNRFTSDAFRFYDDSLVIYESIKTNPMHYMRLMLSIGLDEPEMKGYIDEMNFWARDHTHGLFNDNQTIIRFNAFFDLFSFGNYHVHTVFMCFLSLIGLVGIYRTFAPYLLKLKPLLIAGIFMVPSTLFWGSGVLKGSIVIFAMGVLIYSLFRLLKHFDLKHLLGFLAMAFLLLFIKVYIIVALAPAILASFIASKKQTWKPVWVYLSTLVLCCLMALILHGRFSKADIITKLHFKQFDFMNMAEKKSPSSMFELERLNNNPLSFLKAVPTAITNTTFRPFIWDSNTVLMYFNSVENIILLFLGLLCLFFKKESQKIDWNAFLFCATFVVLLYLFIGWTICVSGAIVRYKVPGWPLFTTLFLLLVDHKKLYERIPLLKTLNDKLL